MDLRVAKSRAAGGFTTPSPRVWGGEPCREMEFYFIKFFWGARLLATSMHFGLPNVPDSKRAFRNAHLPRAGGCPQKERSFIS